MVPAKLCFTLLLVVGPVVGLLGPAAARVAIRTSGAAMAEPQKAQAPAFWVSAAAAARPAPISMLAAGRAALRRAPGLSRRTI